MRTVLQLLSVLALAACAEGEVSDDPARQPIPPDQRPDLSGDEDDDGGGDDGDSGGDDGSGDDGGSGGEDGGGGDDGGTDGGGSSGGDDGGSTSEQNEACHPDIEDWPASWTNLENAVVTKINERRAQGADCGSYGYWEPTGPVEMDPDLQCSARYHSLWMAENNEFSHDSPGGDLGDDPWERIDATDFSGQAVGENVAAGYSTAAQVVAGWVDSDGHCANLMNPSATLTGVGYAEGHSTYGSTWTQNFGQ